MSFRTNDELVDYLLHSSLIKNAAVEAAFRSVDRKLFVPAAWHKEAYSDQPLPIGYGQTISQPTTVAIMIELLKPELGQKVLEIGAGSGYVAALLAHLVGKDGSVFAIEHKSELCDIASWSLRNFSFTQLHLLCTDGKKGYELMAPYDRILISAASPTWPSIIEKQLGHNGIMVAPVGINLQDIVVSYRHNDARWYEKYEGFVFVPLI